MSGCASSHANSFLRLMSLYDVVNCVIGAYVAPHIAPVPPVIHMEVYSARSNFANETTKKTFFLWFVCISEIAFVHYWFCLHLSGFVVLTKFHAYIRRQACWCFQRVKKMDINKQRNPDARTDERTHAKK